MLLHNILASKDNVHFQGPKQINFDGVLEAPVRLNVEEPSQPLKSIDLDEDYYYDDEEEALEDQNGQDFSSFLPGKILQNGGDGFKDDGSGHDFLDAPPPPLPPQVEKSQKLTVIPAPENNLARWEKHFLAF